MQDETGKKYSDLAVDVWHCDADGNYSLPALNRSKTSTQSNFLRGVQLTDINGMVEFNTIYPGWYPRRAVHIHLKIHSKSACPQSQHYKLGAVCHTGQIFFPEEVSEQVSRLAPYCRNKIPRTHHLDDFIFREQNGEGSLAEILAGREVTEHGVVAVAYLTMAART